MLLEKVKTTIAYYAMLSRGDTILVAVSGGVDSVVLLDLLCRLAGEFFLKLAIAHLDHGLRGEDSEEDAQFVVSLAEEKEIPVIRERIDVCQVHQEKRLGLEEAGRLVRRRFLEETARKVSATRIAVGHTLNDRVETLLFNLIRGAGPSGLTGIRPVSPPYIRPLIETTAEEVLAFAHTEGLAWREDRTNHDTIYTRNRIRHRIIPLLQQLNPRLLETLQRTADLLLEEDKALDVLLDRPWKDVISREETGSVRFRRDRLARLSRELQGLLMRRGIARARGNLQGIEKIHVDGLRHLVASPNAHGETHLPALVARIQGNELLLTMHGTTTIAPYDVPIDLGRTELPLLGIALDLSIHPSNGSRDLPREEGAVELADADRIDFPLRVRSRREGDRFRPLGMGQEKRLKDFLIDDRVPFYDRSTLPLLCDQSQIVWVVGVRLSDAVRITEQTERVLVMQWETLE
jgi:tRNA(Ile)-lysidine synthase